jgi:DNA-binding MarR family transcriptional regulator
MTSMPAVPKTRRARPTSTRTRAATGAPSGEALRAALQRFVRSFGLLSSAQTPCGMPLALPHAHALMALLDRQGRGERSTQQDLVKVLGVDKSNVTRLCAKMVEAGHLTQAPSPDDGRAWCVSLTPKGLRIAERVQEASRARFSHLLAALPSDAARIGVLRSLDLLNEAIAETRTMETRQTKGAA